MALVRICDRCGAAALDPKGLAPRTLVVSKDKPGTNAVAQDVEIAIGLSLAQDLCPTCLGSALVVLVLARLAIDAIAPAAVASLAAVIVKAAQASAVAAQPGEASSADEAAL